MKVSDEKDEKELITLSIKRGFILTFLVYILYNYQMFITKFNHNHKINSFFYLFLSMSLTLFLVDKFTPQLSQTLLYGVGWGIGAALLNRILDYK